MEGHSRSIMPSNGCGFAEACVTVAKTSQRYGSEKKNQGKNESKAAAKHVFLHAGVHVET